MSVDTIEVTRAVLESGLLPTDAEDALQVLALLVAGALEGGSNSPLDELPRFSAHVGTLITSMRAVHNARETLR